MWVCVIECFGLLKFRSVYICLLCVTLLKLFGAKVSFFLNLFLFCWSIIIDVGFLQLYPIGLVFNIIFIVILL